MVCNAGAREVQSTILARYPDRKLAVYAIWFNMLPDDSRDRWQPVLNDPRVTNYWDDQRFAGRYYANGRGYLYGAIYDYFFLYGADATWQERPGGWDSTGTTVIDYADQLRKAVANLH